MKTTRLFRHILILFFVYILYIVGMATPPQTTKLQIDVDLGNNAGFITKIADPEKHYAINTGNSIPLTGDVEQSKTEIRRLFDAINKKKPRSRFNPKTVDISEISDEPLRGFNQPSGQPTNQPTTPPTAQQDAVTAPTTETTEPNNATETTEPNNATETTEPNNATETTETNKEKVDGGASNRRLSRRRQHGSNKKRFLVRNKSKKMRRGKYTRKAK